MKFQTRHIIWVWADEVEPHGQRPWSPAAGMESVFNSELTKQKGLTFYNEGEP
jgi:hypothetical protein